MGYRTRERGIWFISPDIQGDKELGLEDMVYISRYPRWDKELGRGGYGLYLQISKEINN